MASRAKQEEWIINYIKEYGSADVCNTQFHDEFHEEFGGKRKGYLYGADPVLKAQALLGKMWKERKLNRFKISLLEHVSGMPNWVYVYELPKNE